jgi:hypothetical protein
MSVHARTSPIQLHGIGMSADARIQLRALPTEPIATSIKASAIDRPGRG